MPEMEERFIREFKRDYLREGKYNIEGQVCHLARLAEHYQRKDKITENWSDCLKVKDQVTKKHSIYKANLRPHGE